MKNNENIFKKTYIENSNIPISILETENILFQMKNNICKIINQNDEKGTGFFIKINYQNNYLYFLVSNYNILKNDIKDEIEININKDKKKIINLNKKRRTFNLEELDIILIEIFPSIDKIKYYLEIDEDINKDIKFKNQSVYLLYYENGKDIKVSYGILKGIDNNKTYQYYNTSIDSINLKIIL